MNSMNMDNFAVCSYNVGGKKISFSRQTIEESGDNFLSRSVIAQGAIQKEIFIDVDYKTFRKWIAPYIRHLILPDLRSIKNGQEKQCIIAVANAVGLSALVEHLLPQKLPKGAFGAEKWESLGIKVYDAPPIPEAILTRPEPEKYVVVLIPAHVSMNDFEKYAEQKIGVGYDFIWEGVRSEYGSKSVKKSYWVAMRKELMPGSRGILKRKEMLELAQQVSGHEAPSILEAIACNIAAYQITGDWLLGVDEEISRALFTCCREEISEDGELDENRMFGVGGLVEGLFVSDGKGNEVVGVAPVIRDMTIPSKRLFLTK